MSSERQPRRSQARSRTRAATHWADSPWQIIGRAIGAACAIVVIAVLLALVVVPRLMGGDSLTVLSGSMEPTFSPGDVVVVKGVQEAEVCDTVSVGSIVTYFPKANDPALITHRVVAKTIGDFDDQTRCRLITQGDANSAVDDPVSPAQLRGVFMYGVPQLGWARQWVAENQMLALAAVVVVLLAAAGWGATRKPRTTVITAPRRSPQAGQTSGVAGSGASGSGRNSELLARELLLRERELELRERELAHAIARAEGHHGPAQGHIVGDPSPLDEPAGQRTED